MVAAIKSRVVEVPDEWAWLEAAYERRWTDGLPLVAPTAQAVERALQIVGREPSEEFGVIPPGQGILTIEQAVLQSLMAGCKPEYIPVVLAAVEALLEDIHSEGGTSGGKEGRRFNLNGVQCTTCHCAPLAVVNGPVVDALGFNTGAGLFNSGHANLTVGRAVRLILWNIGGGYYGEIDMATYGHPGKISYCIAEAEKQSPWESLAVERGFSASESVVTVAALDAPHDCYVGPAAPHPFRMLDIICDVAAQLGPLSWHFGDETHMFFVLSPRVAQVLAEHHLSKRDVKQYIFDHARRSVRDIEYRILRGLDENQHSVRRSGDDINWYKWIDIDDPDATVPVVKRVEEAQVVVAGKEDSWWCAVLPSWGGHGGWTSSAGIVGV